MAWRRYVNRVYIYLLLLLTIAYSVGIEAARAEVMDKNKNTGSSSVSTLLKEEIQKAIDNERSKDNVIQEEVYRHIILKYIDTNTNTADAVSILREAGFGMTVFGDGFYEAYPISGYPARGTLVSATLYYNKSFFSGNALVVNMSFDEGNYKTIKDIKIVVGTISP